MAKHILSKSTFMYGCQCTKRLFLHKFRSELANLEDKSLEAIFQSGTNTGLLARGLFPGGVDASPADPFSYQQSVKETQEYLKTQDIIYEAAFQFDGVLCAVDILVKEGTGWRAFEVKSTNSVKDQHRLDAALQYHVLTMSGLPLIDISIIHLNRDYVKIGELDVLQLFAQESVFESSLNQLLFVADKIQELKMILADKKEPEIAPGYFCYQPYKCNFTEHCWSLSEVKDDSMQLPSSGEREIDNYELKQFFKKWSYPLYFLDFETVMYGVPAFDYSSPYQQIPFQYSLHVQESQEAPTKHMAYLGDGITDPRLGLILQLLKDLNSNGSIIVWNKTFESGCLKKLAENFPEYNDQLLSIIDRLQDLMIPFRKGLLKYPEFNGSYSIKKILPILVPELSYSDLDIQEGVTASFTYSQLPNQDGVKQAIQRNQLLEYCKLDTLAMVRIYEKLQELISE